MSPDIFKPVQPSQRLRKKSLVLKLMIGGRGLSLRLSPVILLLVLAVGWAFWAGWQRELARREAEHRARIAELEEQNKRLETFIARKEREKNQMLALAEARSSELWDEIETRDRQIEQLWKTVGKAPAAAPAPTRRKSLSGSRSGALHPLEVKLKYRELYSRLRNDGELHQLKVAADDYREEKERKRQLALLNAKPSIWPCHGLLSSGFGYRVHPVYGYSRFHSGADITAPYGVPIRATAAGRVVTSAYMGGYGNAIEIDHGNGLRTLYGHCSSLAVGQGAFVKKGQTIAYVGSTGVSTGPHVHYEVHKNGTPIDPSPYLVEKDLESALAKK